MEHLNDKASCQKPGHFLSNGFAPFFIKPAEELFYRFILRIHIKSVLSEFPRYTWHVRGLPCKNVPILTDELDERALLFGIQVGTDSELLGRIAGHEVNKLGLSCRFELQI